MKYGFIGCGNMGGALIRAAAAAVDPREIFISNRTAQKAELLAKETGVMFSDNMSIAESCDYIFLGVKPQNMAETISTVRDTLKARKDDFVLVSMAAAVSIEDIRGMYCTPSDGSSGKDVAVIRIMPNLPVSVGEGVILMSSECVSEEQMECFKVLLSKAGLLIPVEEKLIDAGSAISGCGPAFAFMFIEALADGGVECGLPRKTAKTLAAQMLLGSAKQALSSGLHPEELKDNVCSPGGSTIAGVHALEEKAFRSACAGAVLSAYEKTLNMKK